MKRNIWIAALIICFWMMVAQNADAGRSMERPVWKEGQSWVVKVSYPNPLNEDEWSSPVLWKYTLVEDDQIASQNRYKIIVTKAGDDRETAAIIYLNKQNLTPLSVETMKQRQGKKVTTKTTFEVLRPLHTATSKVPIDIPIFPVVVGETYSYAIPQEISGELIRNREMHVVISMGYLPQEAGVNSNTREYIKISAVYDNGKEIFTQYWDETKSWPVFGQNDSMRYWLVDDEK